jgi:hypothetical protein
VPSRTFLRDCGAFPAQQIRVGDAKEQSMTRLKGLSRWAIVLVVLLASVGTAHAETRLLDAVKAAD